MAAQGHGSLKPKGFRKIISTGSPREIKGPIPVRKERSEPERITSVNKYPDRSETEWVKAEAKLSENEKMGAKRNQQKSPDENEKYPQ
jgi:hypothetical protein